MRARTTTNTPASERSSPTGSNAIRPAARLAGLEPYQPPPPPAPVGDAARRRLLRLDANEGPTPGVRARRAISSADAETLRRYPDATSLESRLAGRWGVGASRIVATSGGDDAIDRLCRAVLEPGRRLLLHRPTFEMIERSGRLAGASIESVPWMDGAFPTQPLIDAIGDATTMVALVSPNNPTGGVIPSADIRRIADAAAGRDAIVMLDLAYAEFADEDPTGDLLDLPNVVIVRTFSKALGLAGLRVGYAIAPPPIATWLRTVGSPYPVTGPSLAAAAATLDPETVESSRAGTSAIDRHAARIREERARLASLLQALGAEPLPSQANFICARLKNADGVRTSLGTLGISVRGFPGKPGLGDHLRITLPGDPGDFGRLARALTETIAPGSSAASDALGGILDMDAANTSGVAPTTAPSEPAHPAPRTATLRRATRETEIDLDLSLDGSGDADVRTGLGFLDHMLTALARHARLDLTLRCVGDLHVDDHHTVEDCALALGTAIDRALGDKRGIARFGAAHAPLDEALARVVLDLSGRPHATVNIGFARETIGEVATENLSHFFVSLASTARLTLHADVIRGDNDHHKIEAVFKALALALGQAIGRDPGSPGVPSTKGVL